MVNNRQLVMTESWASVDSFTVPLHNSNGRHLPAIRAVQRDHQWRLKNGGNSHGSLEPIISQNSVKVSPSLYLDQPIKELATSANGRPRLIADSPNGTILGLCNSLRFHLLLLIYVEWLVDGVWLLSNIINSSLKLPGSVSMSWRNPKMKSFEYFTH